MLWYVRYRRRFCYPFWKRYAHENRTNDDEMPNLFFSITGLKLTPGLREKIVIVAKMDIIFPSTIDTSKEHLLGQVDWFLQALQTTYIDVMLLHYPNSFMNTTEVAEVFLALKRFGVYSNSLFVKYRHTFVVDFFALVLLMDLLLGLQFWKSSPLWSEQSHAFAHRRTPKATDKGLILTFLILLFQHKLTQGTLQMKTEIDLVTNEVEVSVWNPGYLNYNSDVIDHAESNGYHVLGWGGLAGDPIGGRNRLFEVRATF